MYIHVYIGYTQKRTMYILHTHKRTTSVWPTAYINIKTHIHRNICMYMYVYDTHKNAPCIYMTHTQTHHKCSAHCIHRYKHTHPYIHIYIPVYI